MLASAHNGEEKILLEFIKKYLSECKKLKIIIAPRHPERSESIIKMFKNENIKSVIFEDSLSFKEDVFFINSFGKMPLYYSLSDIVILGGSFVKMGGHNPIEPAYNNCVVITGPHIYNWENVFLDMIEFDACIICKNTNELDRLISNLLQNEEKIDSLKTKAKKFSESNFFEIDKLFSKIDKSFKYK
jgi:3-deoxy-D-manno-octulosonic-acid transferase